MKNFKFYRIGFMSVVLAVAMLVSGMAVAFSEIRPEAENMSSYYSLAKSAAENKTSNYNLAEKTAENSGVVNEGIGNTLFEYVYNRTDCCKLFHLPSGEILGMFYGSAVHRKDLNGNWVDIDNKLFYENGKYTTVDKAITIPENLKSGEIMYTFSLEETSFSQKLLTEGANSKAAAITYSEPVDLLANMPAGVDLQKYLYENIKGGDSTVCFEDVFPGVDIIYDFVGNNVAESFVFKSKEAYLDIEVAMDFGVNMEEYIWIPISGLSGYVLYNPGDETKLLRILSQEVVDAAGSICPNAVYEMTQDGNNTNFKLVVDQEWLNSEERVFPITAKGR